jgi:hypothetical protein
MLSILVFRVIDILLQVIPCKPDFSHNNYILYKAQLALGKACYQYHLCFIVLKLWRTISHTYASFYIEKVFSASNSCKHSLSLIYYLLYEV